MSGRLTGRIALVTGASRGIGRAVALAYAQAGATVIAYARTKKDLESLDDEIRTKTGSPAVLVAESLTDYAKIDQTAAAIFQRYQKLDILVGNAGTFGQMSPMGHYTPKMWDEVMAVNLTANWRLIRAFDPLLRQSDAGRAIFVTSGVARITGMYWGPYGASKAALEHMVKTYAAEMAHTKVRVNLLDPATVRTNMRAQVRPGEDPMTVRPPEAVAQYFLDLADPACTKNGQLILTE